MQPAEGRCGGKKDGAPGSREALEHYLGLILVHLWRLLGTDFISHQRSPRGLAERFVTLTGQHRHQHWTVQQYASALEVRNATG
jgi:hypothetical protein